MFFSIKLEELFGKDSLNDYLGGLRYLKRYNKFDNLTKFYSDF